MRLVNRAALLLTTVLVVLVLPVAAANAEVEVFDEETGADCGAVSLVVHDVSGGCHVEFRSERHIPLVADIPGGPVTIAVCDWHLEAQVGGDGSGFVTAAAFTDEDPPATPPCVRAACDEASGAMLPWPINVTEVAGVRTVELTLCVRSTASGPGGPGTQCELRLPWANSGGHRYEIGVNASYACANIPLASFQQLHLVNEVDPESGAEDIEIRNVQSVEVYDEETGADCDAVSLVVHDVSGGCHVEFRSERHIPLVADIPGGPVTLSVCDWHLEARVGGDGSGFVTAAAFTDEDPPATPPCLRAACDEASGVMRPWPIHVTEVAGVRTVELTLCVRTTASGPGVPGTQCELRLPWANSGGHRYEIGVNASYACANIPQAYFQQLHLVNEVDPESGAEDIEVIH